MVSIKQKFTYLADGELDLAAWLGHMRATYHPPQLELVETAAQLAKQTSKGLTTFYGQACIEQGLEMAEIVLSLKLDQNAVAAAILLSTFRITKLTPEQIAEKISPDVAKLIHGVQQMDNIHTLQKNAVNARDVTQIDRFRKLLLAMVSDIRVVIIKLAERTCILRGIKHISLDERKHIAQETMDVYAPLANRLGIGQLKWELEDVAFHYIDPVTYKTIAKFLAERRVDRERHIHDIIDRLKEKFHEAGIHAEIAGRAKHIYSIYLKAQRKDTDYHHIYDYSAIRLLVPDIQDCYTALSIVHSLWEHIPQEFDDYITSPKANGYRSIHTAVIGPAEKTFEIQVRTHQMHEEAERGVAAHWVYKEGKSAKSAYETKIGFLRQLLDWHRDVAAGQDDAINPAMDELLNDRIYVFTPRGDILDLPAGSTPLDCAYHIHSQIGNKCRGAKINGHIVPLTYTLRTGEQVEILTNPNGVPSRDWLKQAAGYLMTPRARSKVAHWFRQQDLHQHSENGRRVIEREFAHTHTQPNLQKLATHFQFKDEENFLAAVGRGQIRPTQLLHYAQAQQESNRPTTPTLTKRTESKTTGMTIAGISDLMTRIARCCKPIPSDDIVGFITQGRGVSIHKTTCNNVKQLPSTHQRIIQVTWDQDHKNAYYVDVQIRARDSIIKEVTSILTNSKINLVNFNSTVTRNNLQTIVLTIQINSVEQLGNLLNQFSQLPGVTEAKRLSQ